MQTKIFYQIFVDFRDITFLDRQVNSSQILLCRNKTNIEFAAVYSLNSVYSSLRVGWYRAQIN